MSNPKMPDPKTFDPTPASTSSEDCPFCHISSTYPASPSASDSALDPDRLSPPAFIVLHSSPLCIAFLDIMPLSPGHLLVTTRRHCEKVSDIGEEEARELGAWLRTLSRVLAGVTGVWDWNIVQNNGMAIAARSAMLLIGMRLRRSRG
jgi:diadenosine tetraphosphate (Ap4A) HIT family hydrolase